MNTKKKKFILSITKRKKTESKEKPRKKRKNPNHLFTIPISPPKF